MPKSIKRGRRKNPKIILIDAESDRAERLAEALGKEGFKVITCRTTHGVLGCLRQENPDAVIVEVILPSKSGFEIAARMQADRSLSQIPVFFTTDIQDSGGGNHDYFSRPFELSRLILTIRERIKV